MQSGLSYHIFPLMFTSFFVGHLDAQSTSTPGSELPAKMAWPSLLGVSLRKPAQVPDNRGPITAQSHTCYVPRANYFPTWFFFLICETE